MLWMKRVLSAMVIVLLAFTLFGCGCSRVDPGHVGIKVNLYGSDKGVSDLPLVTGMVWYNPITTKIFHYPTFVQTAVWTASKHEGRPIDESLTFNSKEGLVINVDVSLSYQIEGTKVPAFYVKFRSDDLNIFTHGFLRNVARDAFNEVGAKMAIEDIYGEKKENLIKEVKERINRETSQFGVTLQQFGFIGAPRLPKQVVDALNAKIEATQTAIKVENEVRQAKAEAQKAIAKAEGEARANQILTQSITPQLIQWRSLQITQDAVGRWDGKRPMVEGSGSGLLLQITPGK